MQSKAATVQQYVDELPPGRQAAFTKLLSTIRSAIDPKFSEAVMYGMVGWVIPKKIYPPGYHVDPTLPVSFMGIANQKNYIALYHMGIYADEQLLVWFRDAYAKTGLKLDMGKSCIRFKNTDKIPYDLIAELAARMSLHEYLAIYTATTPTQK
jgi:uncharacterized protein YdhG (YjbR/CyaY superfamily)